LCFSCQEVVGRRKAEIADSSLDVLDQLDKPIKREKIKRLGDAVYAEFRAKADAVTRDDATQFRDALYWELGLMTGWRPFSSSQCLFDGWRRRMGVEPT
jgi:hypothetical protein